MVNKERGEVAIQFDGHDPFPIRPTYDAMVKIESDTGMKMVPLMIEVSSRNIGIHDITSIVFHGAVAAGAKGIEKTDIGQLIAEQGLLDQSLLDSVVEFLDICLSGGKEQKPSDGKKKE